VAAEMEFCLLGPLQVRRHGLVVTVPRGNQRVILATLLLNAGKVVRLDELGESLWGPDVPPSGPAAVQNYVMRLRKALGDAGGDRIITQPPGYLIRLDADELDVSRFEVLLCAARDAARNGSWDQAVTQVGEALELWRGDPLTDVKSELLALREVPRLTEMRLQAIEMRIDADLHRGRYAEVIVELRRQLATHPLREHLHAEIMLALYRDGRLAEALTAYQHVRQVLVEELGTEPGADLQELHQRILSRDPFLAAPQTAPPTTGRAAPAVPHELPAGVRHFTGRADELHALTGMLNRAGEETPGAVVISAIGGTAGVGKTALALHWAHQAAERFPDGQLYVNLRGYDPDQPMSAADALAGFLRSLGMPGQDIPAEQAERAARYRSLLSGKRMLIVLDNAGSAEQVRPLLPGTPRCAVVVTSRDALVGLVAQDGAARLDLDLLPLQDAVSLLRALIGDRAGADFSATTALAQLCCRLPLALRVAAELTATRPATPLADLVDELASRQRLLDLLNSAGDPRTAVRTVFSWSYRHLDPEAARAFRLAGPHPGADLDPYAAAALTSTTLERARRLLDALARAYLIQPAGPGRYGMHDLLRAYARELATAHDGEGKQRAALTRLFDHYLQTAAAAMDILYPAERHRRPRIDPPETPAAPLADPTAARSWLDSERATLVAVTVHTAEHGWPEQATQLAATLFRYLDAGGHSPEAITIHSHARAAASHVGDRAAEATALIGLGVVHFRQGDYEQATGHLDQALVLFRQTGDRTGQAWALNNLGNVYYQQGRYQQAAQLWWQAVNIYREIGDRLGEAKSLANLGVVRQHQGLYRQAISHLQHALTLERELDDVTGQAYALDNLGTVYLRQGRCQEASGSLQQALILFRHTGNRTGEAEALINLGALYLAQRHLPQSASHLQEALALSRETGDRSDQAEALNGLGEVQLATGEPHEAHTHFAAALGLADQIGDKYRQARAHDGLGHACQAMSEAVEARRHWQEALTLYTELGAPETEQVRAQLKAAHDENYSEL
jgi:tetratricopeptide (TPR) repeat protein